jgi:hypothetical protein
MTQIYIAPEIIISNKEFDFFLKQFITRKPLNKIKLCTKLAKQWSNDAENRAHLPSYPVTLPSAKHLSEHVPKEKQGLYAIYAKFDSIELPECFYIGISKKNIYARLVQHLRGDIVKDCRDAFDRLREALEIVICYSTTKLDEEKAKNKLMLLEACMTVWLRPSFLGSAATS